MPDFISGEILQSRIAEVLKLDPNRIRHNSIDLNISSDDPVSVDVTIFLTKDECQEIFKAPIEYWKVG